MLNYQMRPVQFLVLLALYANLRQFEHEIYIATKIYTFLHPLCIKLHFRQPLQSPDTCHPHAHEN